MSRRMASARLGWPAGGRGVGVQRAVFFLESFAQPVKIGLVIFLTEEAGFAVMFPLRDVQGAPSRSPSIRTDAPGASC